VVDGGSEVDFVVGTDRGTHGGKGVDGWAVST